MDIARIRKKKQQSPAPFREVREAAEDKGQDIVEGHERSGVDRDEQEKEKVAPVTESPDVGIRKSPDLPPITKEEGRLQDVSPVEESKDIEVIAFNLGNEEYAIQMSDLEEILKIQRITLVPRAPDYLRGITSIRGKVIPVIDVKKRLCLKKPDSDRQKILLVSGEKGNVALVVDRIVGVIRFDKNRLSLPPSTLNETEADFIEGVIQHE